MQRWVDYMLGALLAAARPDTREKITPLLDSITCQLLALSESVVCESCCVDPLLHSFLFIPSLLSITLSLSSSRSQLSPESTPFGWRMQLF